MKHGNDFTTPNWATATCNAEGIDGDVLCQGLCCAVPCCADLECVMLRWSVLCSIALWIKSSLASDSWPN